MTDSTAPTKSSAVTPSIGGILASLFEADLRVQSRNLPALLATLLLPLVLMYTLGVGKRGVLFPPDMRLAIAIAIGITSGAVLGYTTTMARDRETGVFQRLRVTPAPTWAIMGSRLAIQVVSILAMTVVVFIVGGVVLKLTLDPGGYALTAAVAVLGAAEFLGVGQAIVGLLKSSDTVNAVGRLFYLPLFALGLFGTISIFGSTLETIARWSPGGALINMLAAAMVPSTWSGDNWWSVLVSLGYTVVFAGLGIRWFQWETR